MTKKITWNIGTAGFMISQKQWFALNILNCIEINSTFYRLPTEKSITNWNKFPDNVSKVVKVSKYITHIKRLKDCKEAWEVFWNAIKNLNNTKALLVQLPPSFKNNQTNIDRIKEMKDFVGDIPLVFEFRDISWFVEDIYKIMKSLKFTVCGVVCKKKEGNTSWLGTMPNGLTLPPTINDITYVRVHGGRGYRGFYNKNQLRLIKEKVEDQKSKNKFMIFNNTFFDTRSDRCPDNPDIKYAAVCDAIIMTNLVS